MSLLPFLIFLLLAFGPIACADSTQDANIPPRNSSSYEISKGNYLEVPPDMKIRKIAGNVITTEPDTIYMARKIEEQEEQLKALNARLERVEARLKKIAPNS